MLLLLHQPGLPLTKPAIAREHLLHIAVSLQSDVIRSLQIATRNESAVVDLTALHEASVMLRRDTLAALAELRQRLVNELPLEQRSRLNSDAGFRNSLSSTQRSSLSNSQRSRSSSNFSENLPPAVTILNANDEKPKGVLHRVFSHRKSSSALTGQSSSSSNSEKRHSGYSTMASNMPWSSNRRSAEHQDSISPQSHELPADVPLRLRPPMEVPPPPAYSPNRFIRGNFESDKKIDPAHFPACPRPIHPLERESMSQEELEALNLEAALAANPGMKRSSADLNEAFNQNMGSPKMDGELRPTSWLSSATSVSSRSHYSTSDNMTGDDTTISSANFSGDDCVSLSLATAQPRTRQSYTSIQNSSPFTTEPPPNELTSPPSTTTTDAELHNRTLSAPTVTVIPPQPSRPSAPTTPCTAQTSALPMLGRPCKANNYYNFCKGAWSLREEFKKGLVTRNKPVGMYTSCLVWQCKECSFEGPTFGNKKPYLTDPRTYTYVHDSATIKYKWIFLAKSHVKLKSGPFLRPAAVEQDIVAPNDTVRGFFHQGGTGASASAVDLSGTKDKNALDEEKYLHKPGYCYGCTFCCAEGRVTSVFGNADTLLRHVAEAHAAGLSADAQTRTKCIVGRAPGKSEEWDVCFP